VLVRGILIRQQSSVFASDTRLNTGDKQTKAKYFSTFIWPEVFRVWRPHAEHQTFEEMNVGEFRHIASRFGLMLGDLMSDIPITSQQLAS